MWKKSKQAESSILQHAREYAAACDNKEKFNKHAERSTLWHAQPYAAACHEEYDEA